MLGRRKFLAGTAGTAFGLAVGLPYGFASDTTGAVARQARFIAAARVEGADGGAIWSPEGLHAFTLPARAHAGTQLHNTEQFLLVGRRPGNFAALFDANMPDNTKLITPLPGHRFAGHAAASGNLLVTGELHAETATGMIALRDPASGEVSSSWDAGGIEPHELLFADNGARLIVAMGGIAQDASVKGPSANAGRIESAIIELDAMTGRILHRHVLPDDYSSLSMRHMALAPDGKTIAFGIQDQDFSALRPLIGLLRVGQGIELLELPTDDPSAMRFYIGSIAIDASGQFLVATSPRGGNVAAWSLATGSYLGRISLADVSGLAADPKPGLFWVSSGLGDVACVRANEAGLAIEARWHTDAQFDNHLTVI